MNIQGDEVGWGEVVRLSEEKRCDKSEEILRLVKPSDRSHKK